MIKRAPLKKDPPGKCSRWHVIVYNTETKKHDWHTVHGTREKAEAKKREFESAKQDDEYAGPLERKSFEQIAQFFLDDRRANNCRISTLQEYETELKLRLLPQAHEMLPKLGPQNIRRIRRRHMKAHFNALRKRGLTVSQVNKTIKAAKAIFSYAFDSEYVASNIMHRYPRLRRVAGERRANRGIFSEVELRSIIQNATPFELGLCGTLCTSGAPG